MAELAAAGPVLVHFFDFAQLNSVRALPYAIEWDARYRDAGLTTLGIHSPRFRFTAERAALAPHSSGWAFAIPSPTTRATRSGTTTVARAGPRSSSGAEAGR